MTDTNSPSLLEPESRGGENAGRGFDFQDHYLVAQIPLWLAYEGFTSVMSEAIGDIEVKIYSPGSGESIELIQVKNYRLTPVEFWKEIERFYNIDQGSPGTFRWFRLVAPEFSDEILPLQNGLRRIRSPYNFYPENSGVIQNSLRDFVQMITATGRSPAYAEFLFYRTIVETTSRTMQDQGEALFRQNLGQSLPQFGHLSHQAITNTYRSLLSVVKARNIPIHRKAIEQAIRSSIPEEHHSVTSPVYLHTLHQKDEVTQKQLVIDWILFFGGTSRIYPDLESWSVGVVERLVEIKNFILTQRDVRAIRLTGSRRLSATVAIGSIFSATSGFIISMEHRGGMWWHTDDHQGSNDTIALKIDQPSGKSDELIVSIGIPQDIHEAVQKYAQANNAAHHPLLNIAFERPIETAMQANAIVEEVKKQIREALRKTEAAHIHLFCAVPSFFALLLGHRLNATATVQCYEYVGNDTYVPTCFLRT